MYSFGLDRCDLVKRERFNVNRVNIKFVAFCTRVVDVYVCSSTKSKNLIVLAGAHANDTPMEYRVIELLYWNTNTGRLNISRTHKFIKKLHRATQHNRHLCTLYQNKKSYIQMQTT